MIHRKFRHWITLNDEGKKLYGEIFKDGHIPVVNMLSSVGGIENKAERLYLISHEELSETQVNQILKLLSLKFNAPKSEIRKEMLKNRIPIRAKYVSTAGTNDMRLFI